jgi:hypothetical protein
MELHPRNCISRFKTWSKVSVVSMLISSMTNTSALFSTARVAL